MTERCFICGKEKGQPPERCPGHYLTPGFVVVPQSPWSGTFEAGPTFTYGKCMRCGQEGTFTPGVTVCPRCGGECKEYQLIERKHGDEP